MTFVAVAFVATVWTASIFYPRRFPFGNPRSPFQAVGDIELFYMARTIVSTVNIVLLVFLIVTYASIYIKTRSEFTIGLLIFAIVFFMKDLTSSPFVTGVFGFQLYGLGPFALLPDLFELMALTILLYLSIKY
jgi:hypothetical protein